MIQSIASRSGELRAAVAEAASLLRRSRTPVIGGMMTDIAGAEAAIALAGAIGGVLDHAHAGPMLRDLDAMREAGVITVTPTEARARADMVLIVGAARPSAMLALDVPPTLAPERPRIVWHLCPGEAAATPAGERVVGGTPAEIPARLALLRALVAGRTMFAHLPAAPDLAACAEALQSAGYGVALWSAENLDAMAVEMLCGLIDDLNARTRFAGLPLASPGNVAGIAQATAWRTGYPLRVGLARNRAEHDPWRFDAGRLLAAGEADAAVWINAIDTTPPPWRSAAPLVAMVAPGTPKRRPSAAVTITVGRPAVDHDAVLHDPTLGALAAKAASAPSDLPSVAEVLNAIRAAIGAAEVGAC